MSKIIHFRKKRKSRSEYTFRLGNCHLNYTNFYKYLGVYFNEHLDCEYTLAQFAASAERGLGSIVYTYKKFPEMGYSTY